MGSGLSSAGASAVAGAVSLVKVSIHSMQEVRSLLLRPYEVVRWFMVRFSMGQQHEGHYL